MSFGLTLWHVHKGLGPYSVSKTALLGLTRALAPELAHSNIRVNCVAPGVIKTHFSSAVRVSTLTLIFLFLFLTSLVINYIMEFEYLMY